MSKKILIVTAVFHPVNSPRANRATELTKEFSRQGHEVTVLTPKNNQYHPSFEKKYGVTIRHLGNTKWKTVAIKGKGLRRLIERAMVRFPNLLFEYPEVELVKLVKQALKKEDGYDLMISVAVPYPVHWGVAAARSKQHRIARVWVADCGDPYVGQENDTFNKPFYFKYVEKWFCRKADFLSVPTVGAIQGYFPEFHEKTRVISQGFDFSELRTDAIDSGIATINKPVFAYAGMFIPGRRDPTEFLRYIISLSVDFEFHVYTQTPDLVEPFVSAANGRIILHHYIPRIELLNRLSQMNFVVNFENAGNKQTPSKLIDYAIINRPILSVKTGGLNPLQVDAFLNGDYSEQYIIQDIDQYRIENVCAKFLSLAGEV